MHLYLLARPARGLPNYQVADFPVGSYPSFRDDHTYTVVADLGVTRARLTFGSWEIAGAGTLGRLHE